MITDKENKSYIIKNLNNSSNNLQLPKIYGKASKLSEKKINISILNNKKGILSRRGRACAQNIVPTTTGAASAIGKVIPSLLGKMDGNSLRVPVSDGSIVDVTLELKRGTSIEEINTLFEKNQNETIKFTMDPIVSSDIVGKKVGATVDGLSTNVLETTEGKQLVKVIAWYDNEMGYTAQMMRTAKKLMEKKSV